MNLAGIEAARGLAAILVVFVHTSTMLSGAKDFGVPPFAGLFRFGHAGVDFFFVLSGFIILFIHQRDIGRPGELPRYAWKRFVRIVPVYWIALCIYGLVLAFSPSRDHYERSILAVLTSALLVPQAEHTPIIGVAWSLQHEALFYLLFGLLFLKRVVGIAVLGTWALLCVANVVTGSHAAFPGDFLFRLFNIEFFFGMAVADALRRWRPVLPEALAIAGLVVFFATGILESWGPARPIEWPPFHLAYATGAALTLYGLVGAETTGRLPQIPGWIMALGSASYSIYLLHVLGIMLVGQGLRVVVRHLPLTPELGFAAAVLIVVPAACAFSRLVEQPLLRWCRKPVSPRRMLPASGS